MRLLVVLVAVACAAFGGRVMRPSQENLARFVSTRRVLPPQSFSLSLPSSWDTRVAFPRCVFPIQDQGDCSSCWAFAATEVLSDRFCIASGGAVRVLLSAQSALQCEALHWGCVMGSMPEWAWPFLVKHGATSRDCVPYVSGNGHVPDQGCPSKCTSSNATMKWYRAANYTQAGDFVDASRHTEAIMQALMTGPLDTTFMVYGDFDGYKSGQVYKHVSGSFEGLHSVKIIGYGTSSAGEPYWLVANSWGPTWGDNGTFKILRGNDECMIESQVFYGQPAL